jgi:hypothetical protein
MTVGELKKLLEKYDDEQTVWVVDWELTTCSVRDVVDTEDGPEIWID